MLTTITVTHMQGAEFLGASVESEPVKAKYSVIQDPLLKCIPWFALWIVVVYIVSTLLNATSHAAH